tara:strand:+ start:2400 stop:2768 length:369 start_codon:yes stop_codon:yes gene_type:complete
VNIESGKSAFSNHRDKVWKAGINLLYSSCQVGCFIWLSKEWGAVSFQYLRDRSKTEKGWDGCIAGCFPLPDFYIDFDETVKIFLPTVSPKLSGTRPESMFTTAGLLLRFFYIPSGLQDEVTE